MTEQTIYVVITYIDYRKEVEVEVLRVYVDKDKAIAWAKSQIIPDDEDYDYGSEFVLCSGDVVYDECMAGSNRISVCKSVLFM